MSEVKVNKISPRTNCGTVQLGDSGDTITIPSGATITNNGTQTGFGRTGTVDWDTTAKTASFTAVSGNGYFVNTTSGAVTMTLPATPSAGDIVSVKDYAYTFTTNNLTVNRNGSPIGGGSDTDTIVYSTSGDFLTFIYVDGTRGWVLTNDSTNTDETGAQYIVATGGTVTCCGDYKIHTFTGPGTFCVSCAGNPAGSDTIDYLVIAGGGGSNGQYAGGAGGGGFRESKTPTAPWTASPIATCASVPVSVTAYPIAVGSGGTNPGGASTAGTPGSTSSALGITSTGGGGGGAGTSPAPISCGAGKPGGSGGGAGGYGPGTRAGGTGNTPPVSPPQGQSGGLACAPGAGYSSAGGGGAGAVGSPHIAPGAIDQLGGAGGNGAQTSISGTATYYAGGGGGGTFGSPAPTGAAGGLGGGATGLYSNQPGAAAGTVNTGGGGGGGGVNGSANTGGSGIVIIRYKYQ